MADESSPLKLIEDVEPVQSVIEVCEALLRDAQRGDLRVIAVIGMCKSSGSFECVRGERKPFVLAGMLEHLKLGVLMVGVEIDGSEIDWYERGG